MISSPPNVVLLPAPTSTASSRRVRRVRRPFGGSAIWPDPTIRMRLFRSRGTTPFLRTRRFPFLRI